MRGGSVTLDRAADTCTFHSPSYFWHHDNTVALHDVDYATLRTKSASSYIAIVLVNGDDQTFADSTDQEGKGRATKAINDYMGAHQNRR